MSTPRWLVAASVFALDGFVLRACWVDPRRTVAELGHPYRWVADVGADAASAEVARLGLWLCAAWFALAVGVCLASGLPGAVGRVSTVTAAHTTPALVRRAVALVVGTSVVLSPVAAIAGPAPSPSAATAAPLPAQARSATAAGARLPGSGWARSAATAAGAFRAAASATASETGSTGSTGVARHGTPGAGPVPWPHSTTVSEVTVRPGDCLWAIAAHRLGRHATTAQIATATERWYDANAHAVGGDPNLIHPGLHLHAPIQKGP